MTDRATIRPLEEPFRLAGRRVWVAGHRGMVGAACVRRLASEHCEVLIASRDEADLRRQEETEAWVQQAKPEVVPQSLMGGEMRIWPPPAVRARERCMAALPALIRLAEAAADVATSGVSYDEPRLDYMEVQVNRAEWVALCAALDAFGRRDS